MDPQTLFRSADLYRNFKFARNTDMLFKNYERIVFAGDSVTDVGSQNPVGDGFSEQLGNGYVRIIENLLSAKYPDVFVRVTNSGISGNSTRHLKDRFDRDVINLNPDYISICIGINDVWRHFDVPTIPSATVYPDEYERNLTEMIEKSVKVAKKVFIMSPYFINTNKEDSMRKFMQPYIEICKNLSEKYGCEFINLQEMFDNYCKFRHPTYIARDGIHPNPIGATLIATEFLKHCDFDANRVPGEN